MDIHFSPLCYIILKIKVGFNKTFSTLKDCNIVKIIPLPFYQLWKLTEGESVIYEINSF